jgi:shikimate 5-dehydrogenase
MDLIYRPMQTELLRIAAKKGFGVISGVEMFLAQGFTQWELFMGQRAPEAAMRRAVFEKLTAEESSRSAPKPRR